MPEDVPDTVVRRLPMYVRVLSQFEDEGIEIIKSDELGASLYITPAQIRRDLSHFGRFGRQNRGYDVRRLATELRHILGLDRVWEAVLVGVGRLGRAIAVYPGFTPEGIRIVAAFDADPDIAGLPVGNLTVQPLSELQSTVSARAVKIGIVAVPAAHAQDIINELVEAGIRAILNYAPTAARVPPEVKLRSIDPVLALQSMTYYLRR